ncbi:MAG: hypothetical protein KAH30_04945 [Caldisericia bacterium]|nr:hypothetical protein [Caldisericia bacterium]
MNKITKILLGLCFVVLVLNGCGDVEKLKNDNAQHSTLPDGWTMAETIAEQPARFPVVQDFHKDDLVEYKPESFSSTGILSAKWKHIFSEKTLASDLWGNPEHSFVALKDRWYFRYRYIVEEGKPYKNKYFSIKPETGEFKNIPVQFGVTDGDVIWVDDYYGEDHKGKTICRHKDKGDIFVADDYDLSKGPSSSSSFYIVNKKLLLNERFSCNNLHSNTLFILDPWIGEISWEFVPPSGVISEIHSINSGDMLFFSTIDYTKYLDEETSTQQYSVSLRYYTLNTETLTVKQVFEDYSPIQIISNGDNLFAYDGENLLKLNETFDDVEESFQVGDGLRIINDDRKIRRTRYSSISDKF